jgi:ABC-2 type transport system ATP-binding protein
MTQLESRRRGPTPQNVPAPHPVSVRGLVKSFGRTRALDDLDLTVARGQIHAVLGTPGAGKTTLIKLLLGLLHPDAGSIGVLGCAPRTDAADLHRRIAYVQGEVSLWPNLTGGEVIDLTARMHGGIVAARRDALLDQLRLDPKRQGHTYSRIDRHKLALVAALAAESELLLLDEPSAGLDQAEHEALSEWLDSDRRRGRTVLLTGRRLAEVDGLADRVSILDRGRVVTTVAAADLRRLTRTAIVAELDRPDSQLARLDGVHDFELRRRIVRCDVDGDRLDDVLRNLLACGLRALSCRPPTLEHLLTRSHPIVSTPEPVAL